MKEYINNLIDNFKSTDYNNNKKINIDLILDGGAFSGSYLIGSLLYLKEMEKRNYIEVKRISGCSIGSLLSLVYKLDILDAHEKVYKLVKKGLKNKNMKSYYKVLDIFEKYMPDDFYKTCNKKIYITYYDIFESKQIVKCKYKSNYDLIETIKKSSHIPYAISGKYLYNNRYLDGLHPYMFNYKQNVRTIFLDLFSCEYLVKMLYIKNETNNTERIMEGILKCHSYFFKNVGNNYIYEVYNFSFNTLIQRFFIFLRVNIVKIIVYLINLVRTIKNKKIKKSYLKNIGLYLKKGIQYILLYNSN